MAEAALLETSMLTLHAIDVLTANACSYVSARAARLAVSCMSPCSHPQFGG